MLFELFEAVIQHSGIGEYLGAMGQGCETVKAQGLRAGVQCTEVIFLEPGQAGEVHPQKRVAIGGAMFGTGGAGEQGKFPHAHSPFLIESNLGLEMEEEGWSEETQPSLLCPIPLTFSEWPLYQG